VPARLSRLGLLPLVAALAVLAVHLTVGIGERGLAHPSWKVAYNGLIFAAALACLLGAPRGRRLPWALIAAGLASWAAGNTYWTFALVDLESPPYPSVADAFWLAFYPPVLVALILLVRSRVHSFRVSLVVDGLIGALAVAAVATAVVFGRVLESDAGHLLGTLTNLTYPLADMLLLALVAGALALTGWRADRSWGYLAAAFVVFGASDSLYLYQVAAGTYAEGTLVDLGWPAAAVLFAVAACRRDAGRPARPTAGWLLLGLPSVFAAVGLGVLVLDHFNPVTPLSLALGSLCVLAVIGRMALTFRENLAMIAARTHEAQTDPLTGLGNRRRLTLDLDAWLSASVGPELVLALFDLNGFKNYNDTFGHPAGDELLARLGRHLSVFSATRGTAYRMGGDEFCALLSRGREPVDVLVRAAAAALAEEGDGFSISASYGYVQLPSEAHDAADALRLADQRMYANKNSGRASAGEQSSSVLMTALVERNPQLGEHVVGVAELAEEVARTLGLSEDDVEHVRIAAALHDVGKMAIPDAILNKPTSLEADEWAFVRRHTTIGETILQAAPSLRPAARLVRASHERFDGGGYPDGLRGEDIPLGSRIIFVCDAFDAMRSERPYSPALSFDGALAELRRNAGTQFDPLVVGAFTMIAESRRNRVAAA
jgi:diguanylate cyclase (GGDEF)-like protein/putative nucleotidyltransferase with HDIG domain